MTSLPYPVVAFKETTAEDVKKAMKQVMTPVANTAVAGSCSAIYRNSLVKDGLVTSLSDARTCYDAFNSGLKVAGENGPCFAHRPLLMKRDPANGGNPKWGPFTWQSYGKISQKRFELGSGLLALKAKYCGGTIEDKHWTFGLYAINQPNWVKADHAGFAYSLIPVALFDTLGPESIEYIINHAELSVVITSLDKVHNLIKVAGQCPKLKVIISMDPLDHASSANGASGSQHHAISGGGASGGLVLREWAAEKGIQLFSIDEVEAMGKAALVKPRPPTPNDVATICYTSGTTGNPKGAIVTHANFIGALAGLKAAGIPKLTTDDLHISYLPLAHIYERLSLINCVYHGTPIAFYRGDVTLLFEDIATIKPTLFNSVPRLFNRIHAAILQKTLYSGSAITAALFRRALEAKSQSLKATGSLTHAFWDRIIFNKIKNVLGGRVRMMISGSAPISADVLTFLRCCFSCEVFEGWGQTETCAACSITLSGDFNAGGSIGGIIPCAEVKLVDIPDMKYLSTDKPFPRGEIVVRGANVMSGYFKEPKKTAETLDADGWLSTGDIGLIDNRGLLRIIDRKKHIFKLSQGEYVAPEKLENMFITSGYILQLFVHGDSLQSELVMIVVPEPEFCVKKAIEAKILPSNTPLPGPIQPGKPLPPIMMTLAKDARFKKMIMDDVNAIGKANKIAGFEFPKDIFIEPKELMSIDNGLLTPTLKMKRDVARDFYSKQIAEMYSIINAAKEKSIEAEAKKTGAKL